MEWNEIVLMVLAVALLALYIGSRIYNSQNHTKYDEEKLRKNAKVIDVKWKEVGDKSHRKFRTTVTFDDSFQFISHYTDRENHFGYYEISLSKELKRQVLEDAIEVHAALVGDEITYGNSTHCDDCKVRLPKCTTCPVCGKAIMPK